MTLPIVTVYGKGIQIVTIDETPSPIDPPPVITPPPIPAGQHTALWEKYALDPTTVIYYDGRPTAQYVGNPTYHIPYLCKHNRGAYRPSTGKLYYGGGDFALSNGLTDDDGPSDANSALFSLDPLAPTTMTLEQHRFLPITKPDAIHMYGCDEGAMDWNTTSDRLIVSPNNANAFLPTTVYNNVANPNDSSAGLFIPVYVAANKFSHGGDWSAFFYVGRHFQMGLTHPDFPTFTYGQNIACYQEAKVTAVAFAGGTTTVTFAYRADYQAFGPMTFSAAAKGIAVTPVGPPDNCWRESGMVWYRESDKTYHAGLLEFNADTRTWTRINFKLNYYVSAGTNYPLNTAVVGVNVGRSMGCFAPASVTGRGDEFICLHIDFGGYYGAYHFEYATHVLNYYQADNTQAPTLPEPQGNNLDRAQGCIDPVGKKLYAYSPAENRLYQLDLVTHALIAILNPVKYDGAALPPQPVTSGDAAGCIWNADLGMIELYRGGENSSQYATLYLINPTTGVVSRVGDHLSDGTPMQGNMRWRCGNRTVFDPGGAFLTEVPTTRQIFVGAALTFQPLEIAPHLRVDEVYSDPVATDAKVATLQSRVPFRMWGGFAVDANGIAYLYGGNHSDMHSTAVDNCDLSKVVDGVMPWQQNIGPPFNDPAQTYRRPHLEPATYNGQGMYGSAGTGYLWYSATEVAWANTGPHMYTQFFAHPTEGLINLGAVPTNLVMPSTPVDSVFGVRGWNRTTGKFKAYEVLPNDTADMQLTDWTGTRSVWFNVPSSRDRTQIYDWTPSGLTYVTQLSQVLAGQFSYESFALWLEGNSYIVATANVAHTPDMGFNSKLWHFDRATNAASNITNPAYLALCAQGNPSACADRDHRKIWWLIGKDAAAPLLYFSTFDHPGDIRRAPMVDNPAFRVPVGAIIYQGFTGLRYWNNYLWIPVRGDNYFSSNYEARFWRIPVY